VPAGADQRVFEERAGREASEAPAKRAVDRSYIDTFREHSDDPRLSALMLFLFQTGARISDALDWWMIPPTSTW
jgi:hypothetical protein